MTCSVWDVACWGGFFMKMFAQKKREPGRWSHMARWCQNTVKCNRKSVLLLCKAVRASVHFYASLSFMGMSRGNIL